LRCVLSTDFSGGSFSTRYIGKKVKKRKILQVSWTCDHRIIDGGIISRFCNQWKEYMEDPTTMLMKMR
jgi:pyruvate/2-oxoglutarate dehydrogenase complex dihydrolipoamide acyltransferase (E2) component